MRPINKINRPSCYKVTRWIEDNWGLLQQEKFTIEDVCKRIFDGTGVKVTSHVLKSICRDAEIKLRDVLTIVKKVRAGKPEKNVPIGAGRSFRLLATQVAATQYHLEILFKELGVPFNIDGVMMPEWLRKYAGGKVPLPADETKVQS